MKLLQICLLVFLAISPSTNQICPKHIRVPSYPRLARMAQLEGTVSLDVEVGTDGNVISVRASGAHKLLQKASEENVRQWVFERSPDKEGAILRGEVVYTYKLEGKAEYYDSAPTVTLDLPSRVLIVARPAEVQP